MTSTTYTYLNKKINDIEFLNEILNIIEYTYSSFYEQDMPKNIKHLINCNIIEIGSMSSSYYSCNRYIDMVVEINNLINLKKMCIGKIKFNKQMLKLKKIKLLLLFYKNVSERVMMFI